MTAPALLDFFIENRTGTGDPVTKAAAIPANTKAAVLTCTGVGSATDHYLTATVGGVSMTRVTGAEATDSASETCRTAIFFLGSGLVAGAANFVVDLSSATGDDMLFCITYWSADGDCEVIDSDKQDGDFTNPSRTMNYGGREGMSVAVLTSGHDAIGSITENGNMTLVTFEHDHGTMTTSNAYQTTGGTSDFTISWTAAAEDGALSVVSFAAIPGSPDAPIIGGGFFP